MISEYVRLKIGTNKIRLNLPEIEQYPLLKPTLDSTTQILQLNVHAEKTCQFKQAVLFQILALVLLSVS